MAELLHTAVEIQDHTDAVDLAQVANPNPNPNPKPKPNPEPDPKPKPNSNPNPSPNPAQVVRDAPPEARDVRFDD
eukprot:scaffold4276_cov36-Phaeocystis_antarctica.AAC.1